MISTRRMAREWALKILYQMDVGRCSLQEALDPALERLRMEFVQRGSRTASGSMAEEICLNAITIHLGDTLPDLRLPMERVLEIGIERIFEEAPYWQEVKLERALKTRFPGLMLNPPRLLTPLPESRLFPPMQETLDELATHLAQLTDAERTRYAEFVSYARTDLPRLLSPEMRRTVQTFMKQLVAERPITDVADWLHRRRREFHREQAHRWRKVATMVQKQTGDWLRTATFTHKLVTGVHTHQQEIDEAIGALSAGWRLERQVAVDRNILRMAGYELLFLPAIPVAVTINEAVELAKKYSTAESGRFVNGVLGALAARTGKKQDLVAAQHTIEGNPQEHLVEIAAEPLHSATE
ncbi:MAG: transcription antitermination factor NusB [Chloroherpetonaceae bacterium]|nr:transcription antitermination factor NusB [Chthonomonadaceae bacterium]MDW8208348.1 transcription antitermination factor NusB [Chloroherpetonaceae bacterium]